MVEWFKVESHRAWLYRVALAALALAGVYGLVSDEDVVGWTAVVTALLGNGLAALNTSTK